MVFPIICILSKQYMYTWYTKETASVYNEEWIRWLFLCQKGILWMVSLYASGRIYWHHNFI